MEIRELKNGYLYIAEEGTMLKFKSKPRLYAKIFVNEMTDEIDEVDIDD